MKTAQLVRLFHCPEPGCLIFPYDVASDLDEHVASGCHVFDVGRRVVAPAAVDGSDGDDAAGSGGPARSDKATDKQRAFIASLIDKRHGGDPQGLCAGVADAVGATLPESAEADAVDVFVGSLTRRQASAAIETLKAMPPAAPTSGGPARTNRYPGSCAVCGARVAADAGSLTDENGRWVLRHFPTCPPSDTAKSTLAAAPEPGVYSVDGVIYRVQTARTGRLYAKVWDADVVGWEYVGRGSLDAIAADGRPLTAEEAAAFGHATGVCVFCARSLSDDRSVSVGYGPTCAAKQGLPWGEVP